jgi:hypothetical protein
MIDECNFCGMSIESDGTEEHRYKMLVFHIWLHHYETGQSRSLRDVCNLGPMEEEE